MRRPFRPVRRGPQGANMSETNLPVTSREYKLMLNTGRFKDRDQGSEAFFELIEFLIRREGGRVIDSQGKEESRRTSYLDTADHALRQKGFALRLREEAKGGFKINLKYRTSDHHISAAQDVSSPLSGDTKFEEDILPPFTSKFSLSTSIGTETPPDLSSIGKVAAFFPGVARLGIDQNAPVKTVNDFIAEEVVRRLCKFQFNRPPTIKACLSFWYLTMRGDDPPLVAEFSFNYDILSRPDRGRPDPSATHSVECANRFFRALQSQPGWVNLDLTTKTTFALEVL